jgi:signal peptidase II
MQAARGAAVADPANPPRAPRRTPLLVAVAAIVLILDVVSKLIVVQQLSDRSPVHVIGTFLQLTLTRNPGAAFGIGTGATIVFTVVAVAVVVVIARSARRLASAGWSLALGLLLGGAVGNLTDRLFRSPGPLRGHVVDWIELPHWPVFNLADSAIVLGGILAAALAVYGVELDGSRRS